MGLRDFLAIVDAGSTPILAVLAFFVWRIYDNHLPHIEEKLEAVSKAVARLEGIEEGKSHGSSSRASVRARRTR